MNLWLRELAENATLVRAALSDSLRSSERVP
jgi:hypothetical protein